MWVSRIRITGGFLSGLDLRLHPGLNVVIGPRGAGKTSLLELVRHALGLSHAQHERSSRQHELIGSILGAGEVILDIETDHAAQQLIVDASGRGRRLEYSSSALMIGQNELESIASDPESRLRLIDLRADVSASPVPAPDVAVLTRGLFSLREEMATLTDQLRARTNLLKDREVLASQEAKLMSKASSELGAIRGQLGAVENKMRQLTQDSEVTERALAQMASSSTDVSTASRALQVRSTDTLRARSRNDLAPQLKRARLLLADTHIIIEQIRANLQEAFDEIGHEELALRAQATPLRRMLEESEKGLGEVTAKLRNIDLQLSRFEIAGSRLKEARTQHVRTAEDREALLDEFELAQEQRYNSRTQVAQVVTERLKNRVVISIEHLTDSSEYQDLLMQLLQGSGIQFRGPAEAISRATLPRQLVKMIETGKHSQLAQITGLPEQRVSRALAHLDDPHALSMIASVNVEDAADFLLRVGPELKSVEQLSTGQKCAVTLPILLTEHTKSLVLDQPEDHLDNAYLVETVVRSISDRVAAGAQTIVATHNANIPVLGNADMVASLNSDGRRGYISHTGHVDEPSIVHDITNIMEGGLRAFRARADFYNLHGTES